MEKNSLIKTELMRLQEQADNHKRMLLDASEAYIAAHELVDILKKNGADGLSARPIYLMEKAEMVIHPGDDCVKTIAAIRASGIEISDIRSGYNDSVFQLRLRGYDVDVYVLRSAVDLKEAA